MVMPSEKQRWQGNLRRGGYLREEGHQWRPLDDAASRGESRREERAREAQSRSLQNETNGGIEAQSKRPLHYWDDLRENALSYETREGSAVYKVEDGNETVRLAHIASLHPYSEIIDGMRVPADLLIYLEASMFLAMHHFNERSPIVLPHLPDLLSGCNLYMTMEILDTILSPIVASQKALDTMVRPNASIRKPPPTAIVGASRSAVSQPLSVLAGVNGVPMVSGQSTSSALDIKETSPTFVRTVPTNRLDAQAAVVYLKSLGVGHFGVLFVRDPYGSEFHRDILSAAASEGLVVASAAYNDKNEASIVRALKKLKNTQFRYFFAVLAVGTGPPKSFVQTALDMDMIGNREHVWLFSEATAGLLEEGFYQTVLNSSVESDRQIAKAMSGTGMVLLDVPQNEGLNKELSLMGLDKPMYDYFVSKHDAPEVFTGLQWRPDPFFYQYLCYDVIIALGVGLCNMTEEFPSGPAIVDAVKATEFLGSSGSVSFDSYTGTRTEDSVKFKVVNLLVDPSEDNIEFSFTDTALIHFNPDYVEVLAPFVYAENTTEIPPPLPLLDGVNYNLLGNGVRILGWTLAGVVVVLSIGCGVWTYRRRHKDVVRASQPLFLGLLCVGTTLMAAAIIPMSFQEPMSQKRLDTACMSTVWVFTMGFSTAFGSLFSKLLRINKLFRRSANMRRVSVKAKDVILPFVLLSVFNFAILLSWTLVAPLRWTRVEVANFDRFERSLASYGTCFAQEENSLEQKARNAFVIALVVFNLLAVIFANYQAYLSRHVPSDFNESFYIGLSMASILEGFLIGVPILFLVRFQPSANFVVSSILIAFLCMAILVPTFVSKIMIRRGAKKMNKASWRAALQQYSDHKTNSQNRVSSDSLVARSSNPETGEEPFTTDEPSRTHMNNATTVAEIRARAAQRTTDDPPRTQMNNTTATVAEIRARVAKRTDDPPRPQMNNATTVAEIRARVAQRANSQ